MEFAILGRVLTRVTVLGRLSASGEALWTSPAACQEQVLRFICHHCLSPQWPVALAANSLASICGGRQGAVGGTADTGIQAGRVTLIASDNAWPGLGLSDVLEYRKLP